VKTKLIKQYIDIPRRPDQIALRQLTEVPIIISNKRLLVILEEIESGERSPLDHACLTIEEWAELKRADFDVLAYIKQSENYFEDIERQDKAVRASKTPPKTVIEPVREK